MCGQVVQQRLIFSKKQDLQRGLASRSEVTLTSDHRFTASSVVALPHLGRTSGAALTLTLVVALAMLYPAPTKAGILDEVRSLWQTKAEASSSQSTKSVQTMPLLKAAMNIDPNPAKGGGEVTIVDGEALVPEEGPAGTIADIEKPKNQSISIYVVREGDTLSGIANMFGVTTNTIKWANDIPPSGTVRIGQTLTILPVTGVKYTVKKGDTMASIAKKFGADAEEVTNFNGIETLAVGIEIIIPDGEIAAPVAPKSAPKSSGGTSVASSGSYSNPLPGGRRTQGIHGYNGVDLAGVPVGTPVLAAASGEVIVARQGGYNGGYGSYVVIKHDNGTQTLYGHLSSVTVGIGETIGKGQAIGGVGNSGRSTGPHLHFEIRGGPRNPF
ncbi:MAG: M23 family metallopeptidase [Patescibacteria group bacterium]